QATFLVLVRKAASLKKPELLGNWLFGVARRTAREARTRAARRRRREQQTGALPESAVAVEEPEPWPELRPLLDEELGQLPEKYRVPLTLCYLEGQTHQAVAQTLGIPSGSMSWRLARGCELLRRGLRRRGVTLSGTALAATLSEEAVRAAVPVPL